MKKAFTLAEIMIVIMVIGILSAILLPVAFQSAPDENVTKFKKSHNILGTIIRELVNSDRYYSDGDLGTLKNGSAVTSAKYFCESMADVLSIKKKDCKEITNASYAWANGADIETAKTNVDKWCAETQTSIGAEIITSDDVSKPRFAFRQLIRRKARICQSDK